MAYSTITKPADYFNTVLYTGNGSTQSITGVGFQPDFVWIKDRDNGTFWHFLFDAVRGATERLVPNETNAEATSATSLTAFDSDGFSLGDAVNVNTNTDNFVSWNLLGANGTSSNTDGSITSTVSANTTSGFSIVSYTGTGANATVGHGLGIAPSYVIVKARSVTGGWVTWVKGFTGDQYLTMQTTNAVASSATIWNSTVPSTDVFNIGTNSSMNTSGATYIAYCFAEKKGFSKFGSYTGNGNADGPFIYTGFKPAFVMWKRTDTLGYDWDMYDTARDTYNVAFKELVANAASAESSSTVLALDILSNGFKLRTSNANGNASGGTYIYMAFAENPLVANIGGGIPATAR